MKNEYPKIIAEVGVNHNGNIDLLKKLIDKISKSGVDYIKFQAFITDKLVIKKSPKAQYQKKIHLSQYAMLKKYELKPKHYDLIFKRFKKKKLNHSFQFLMLKALNY